ncbi:MULTISPECIES: nicotinamide riboside transporter PnuC [unclassified Lysinibacillus]|uniref:nicotinamide riboside transporter PnuC n=1 Tax=unclassified Lysinibacillus TaxID=2636778 RepID=UPI0011729232|nr:nicotinamide riboside transporter PnuC [Lysinibacillus sp. CD3-6]QPQ34824.1 nicotinamide mononucleotide transporter [Lysinibacillus sp. JNUCC-52]UED79180.1 nicotinamide riboside transporter PnuC [Lysinibacillus sp. CD3-6]
MKKVAGSWNLFEITWLMLFTSIAVGFTVVSKDSLFGFTVFITGVLCVVLAAKGNLMSYVFGMYNTVGYTYLAFINGLFGEVMLNLLFFVPMNVIGFYMWKNNRQEDGKLVMRQMNLRALLLVVGVCVIGCLLIGFGLSFIPGQNSPYIDAITTVLSVVATILMVRRFKEQWLVYIVLNLFTVLLWAIRMLEGSGEGLLMIVMWSAYLVNAVYGYYTWNKVVKEVAV